MPCSSSRASTASFAQQFLDHFEVVPDFCNIVFDHIHIPLDPLKALPDWRNLPL
jgi:hypothetical protein